MLEGQAYEGSVGDFLVELGADGVDEVLVDLDHLVLLLDLLVERLAQVLDGGRDLHLLLAHEHAPALVGHLRLQVLDHGLGALHLLQQLAVLGLEAHHFLLDAVREAHPLVLLRLQLALDALELLLVLLLHDAEGVDEFLDDLERLLDGAALVVAGELGALALAVPALAVQVLLQLDDLVRELLDLLLVDVREVVHVRVVELLDRFGQLRVDVYQLLQRTLQRRVLLVQQSVLLPQVLDVRGEVRLLLPEEGGRHRHGIIIIDLISNTHHRLLEIAIEGGSKGETSQARSSGGKERVWRAEMKRTGRYLSRCGAERISIIGYLRHFIQCERVSFHPEQTPIMADVRIRFLAHRAVAALTASPPGPLCRVLPRRLLRRPSLFLLQQALLSSLQSHAENKQKDDGPSHSFPKTIYQAIFRFIPPDPPFSVCYPRALRKRRLQVGSDFHAYIINRKHAGKAKRGEQGGGEGGEGECADAGRAGEEGPSGLARARHSGGQRCRRAYRQGHAGPASSPRVLIFKKSFIIHCHFSLFSPPRPFFSNSSHP